MEEIEGNEGVFKLGHGGAGLDGVFAEAGEGGFADGQDTLQLCCGIGAVVPEVGVGVGAAEGAGVCVGDEDEAALLAGFEDVVEGGCVFGAAWLDWSNSR